jgi:RsiW-degrading membrane proteinase PrsW (M82 family)
VALVLGFLIGGLYVILTLAGRQVADVRGVTTIGLSIAALGLGLGGALAWMGYRSLRGAERRQFQPGLRWFWGCSVGVGLSLLIGQVITLFDLLASVTFPLNLLAPITFPLFHVLAMSLPALAMLVLVGHRVRHRALAPTQGQVFGQLALGAFGTTTLSIALELLVIGGGLIIVGGAIGLTPEGLDKLAELQSLLTDPALLQDVQSLADWFLKPGILVAVGVLLVIVAPLVEEGAKSIGVPLLALSKRAVPSMAQGWVWGIAVGAGFAIAEGLFNGAASVPVWAGIALLRMGTTVMHMATAGLTGLGWSRTIASKRILPLLGGFLVSFTLHGLWNGLTVTMVVLSLWMLADMGDPIRILVAGLGIMIGLGGLLLLTFTMLGIGTYVTLRFREE